MVLSYKNHYPSSNSANPGKNAPNNSNHAWTKVVTKNISSLKHPPPGNDYRNRQHRSPVTSRRSSVASADSLFSDVSNDQHPATIRPFIKGMEKHSILVDVTDVKDAELLKKAFQEFNKVESENEDGDEDYLGRSLIKRTYLNRTFIETQWTLGSRGYTTILNDGITLSDGTFVKGYKSLPSDAKIVRLRLERLPLRPVKKLTKEMEARLSCFGEVLDLGLIKSGGCNVGIGYATLNIDPVESPLERLEKLQRVIDWDDGEGDIRHVYLQWDEMPPFCRICQKEDHCRADCPDLKKYLECYNCNKKGHMMRNCPRNNHIDPVVAPNKKKNIAAPTKATRKREVARQIITRPTSNGDQQQTAAPVNGLQTGLRSNDADIHHPMNTDDADMSEDDIITTEKEDDPMNGTSGSDQPNRESNKIRTIESDDEDLTTLCRDLDNRPTKHPRVDLNRDVTNSKTDQCDSIESQASSNNEDTGGKSSTNRQ